jgi:tripartite ATP-independent transporter DctP family solute receptor
MYKRKFYLWFRVFCLVFLFITFNTIFISAQQYVLKFGHDYMTDSPHDHASLEFKKIVEERTGEDVKVEVYPAQQLGTGREMIEGMQLGIVQGVALPSSNFAGFNMSISIPDLPFLFSSPEKCHEVLDGNVGNALLNVLKNHQMVGAAWWESGFKCFTANFPIRHPDDFIGKKIRVMPSPILLAQFEAYGANAVPIDFHELYNALQQGVVDGEENPITTIYNMKFYEVQDYITLSNHGFLGYIVAFSKVWLEGLPEDYQDIIISAAQEVAPMQRAEVAKLSEEKYLPEIIESGTQIIELTEDQRAAFEEKAQPVYEVMNEMLDEDGKNLLQKFLDLR